MKKAVFYILIHLRINSSLKIGLEHFFLYIEREDSPVQFELYATGQVLLLGHVPVLMKLSSCHLPR